MHACRSTLEDPTVERAVQAGTPKERIWVDPGIGFGKTLEHNLELMRRLGEFRSLGCRVAIGTSRKSFLGKLLGGAAVGERLIASVTSVAVLAARGAVDLVRVHDVEQTKQALLVVDALV